MPPRSSAYEGIFNMTNKPLSLRRLKKPAEVAVARPRPRGGRRIRIERAIA
jgi:hypothetical protein